MGSTHHTYPSVIRKITLILVLILTGSNELFAQDTQYVNPKSNIIEGSFIEPYTNKWQVSAIDESGKKSVDYVVTTINEKETIKTLSGKLIPTRKISTNKGLKFWLIKEKPYVIQLELQQPNGIMLLWEMF